MSTITKNDLQMLIRAKLLANSKEDAAELFCYPALLSHNGLTRLPESTIQQWAQIVKREMTSDDLGYFTVWDQDSFCSAYSLASEHYTHIQANKWTDNSVATKKFLKSEDGFSQVLKYSYLGSDFLYSVGGLPDKNVASELQYQKGKGVKQFYTVCLLLMFAGYLYPKSSKVKSDSDFEITFETARARLLSFIKDNAASSHTVSICTRLFHTGCKKTRFKLLVLFSFILDSLAIERQPRLEGTLRTPSDYPMETPLPNISYWKEEGATLENESYFVIQKSDIFCRITRWRHGNMKSMFMTCFHDGSCEITKSGFESIREVKDNRIIYNNSFVQSVVFEGHYENCRRIIFKAIDLCSKIDIDSMVWIPESDFPNIREFKILDKTRPSEWTLGNVLPKKGDLLFISRQGLVFSGPENKKYILNTEKYPELKYIGIEHFDDCGLVEYMGRLRYYFKHLLMLVPVEDTNTRIIYG